MSHNINNNYSRLCELYERYKYLLNVVVKNAYTNKSQESKIDELDSILKEVSNLPISWEYYRSHTYKFSQDFEDIVIFYNNANINNYD